MKNNNQKLIVDKKTIEPMPWGDACQTWVLTDQQNMGIFHEYMSSNTSDKLHKHLFSEQFLYVLNGTLGVMINNEVHYLSNHQGIAIPKETPHKVFNDSEQGVEFILFAGPNHAQDRVEINDEKAYT